MLGGANSGAAQLATSPRPCAEQVQRHGPGAEPLTAEAVPTAQRLDEGVVPVGTLLAVPHRPLILKVEEQDTFKPP